MSQVVEFIAALKRSQFAGIVTNELGQRQVHANDNSICELLAPKEASFQY